MDTAEQPPLVTGLTQADADAALEREGPNSLPTPPPTPAWRRTLKALRDPLVLVLLAAMVLTIVTGDVADTIVIGMVVAVNTLLGLRQEATAARAIRALDDVIAPTARVIRDARERHVPVSDLVVGDLVVLREGDLVPADCRLVDANALRVDESPLTGESISVDKDVLPDPDPQGELLAGTTVVHGRARAVVTATGASSALGRIATLMRTEQPATPLQTRMAQLSTILAGSVVALCAVVMVQGLLRGQSFELMLLTAISLAVAAVPESLPIVVTISLALAARRMAGRHAVVRSLGAVETLGSVTLLATDKTGTLTSAGMLVTDSWHVDTVDERTLWSAVALCNDAMSSHADGPLGDPTEVALLVAAAAHGIDAAQVRAEWARTQEFEFDRVRRRMTTKHQAADGSVWIICKGAPESVLSSEVLLDSEDIVLEARRRASSMASAGARVLAVAQTRALPDDGMVESGLQLVGLVALTDPLRPSAKAAVAACQSAGIDVVLVTGDHPETADAIATAVGIRNDLQPAVHGGGAEVGGVGRMLAAHVIARATPADKLTAISGWQAAGQVVAMTGDGVNDGPALRRADVGVAMGRRGTEVARQAADVVLIDDDLATIVAAVEEGRRVFANIRRFLLYGLTGGFAEIVVMLVGPVVGMALPLLPAQLLWVNLLTHSFAGAALGTQPVERGTMSASPRDPRQHVLGGGLWWRIGLLGVAVATMALVSAHNTSPEAAQSTTLLTLGAAQLGIAWGVRSRVSTTVPDRQARLSLPLALAGAGVLLAASVTVGPLRSLLGTHPVDATAWALSAGVFVVAVILGRLVKPRVF